MVVATSTPGNFADLHIFPCRKSFLCVQGNITACATAGEDFKCTSILDFGEEATGPPLKFEK